MISKTLLFPIYIIFVAVNLLVALILKISAWIFYLLGGLFLLTTIFCYYLQLESSEELHRMLICSGAMFMIPQIATMLSVALEFIVTVLGDKIHGKV